MQDGKRRKAGPQACLRTVSGRILLSHVSAKITIKSKQINITGKIVNSKTMYDCSNGMPR